MADDSSVPFPLRITGTGIDPPASVALLFLLFVLLLLCFGMLMGFARFIQTEFSHWCPLVVCDESVDILKRLLPDMCNNIYQPSCNSELLPLQEFLVLSVHRIMLARVTGFAANIPEGSIGSREAIIGFLRQCHGTDKKPPTLYPELQLQDTIKPPATLTSIMSELYLKYSVLPFFTVDMVTNSEFFWSWKKFFEQVFVPTTTVKVKIVQEHRAFVKQVTDQIAAMDVAAANYLRMVAFAKTAVVTGYWGTCSELDRANPEMVRMNACIRLAEDISVKGVIKVLVWAIYNQTDHQYDTAAKKFAHDLAVKKQGTHFATQFDELRFVPDAGWGITVEYLNDPAAMYFVSSVKKPLRTERMRFLPSNIQFKSEFDYAFKIKSLHIPFLLTVPAITKHILGTKYTYPLMLPHLYDAMVRAKDIHIQARMNCVFDNLKDAYKKIAGTNLPHDASWQKAEWYYAFRGIELALEDYSSYGSLLLYDARVFFIMVSQYYCSNATDPVFGTYETRVHSGLKIAEEFTKAFQCKAGDRLFFEGTRC